MTSCTTGSYLVIDGATLFENGTQVELTDTEREEFENVAQETFRKVYVGTVTLINKQITLAIEL